MLPARSLVGQSSQLFSAAALLLLTCLTEQGSGSRVVDVLLEIIDSSTPQAPCSARGGPSVEVHYIEIPTLVGEDWVFLDEVPADDNRTLPQISLPSSSSAEGVQFRLRQLQHDGDGCQCWRVKEFTVSAHVNSVAVTHIQIINNINSIKCSSRGQLDNPYQEFCSEGVREIITHVVSLNPAEINSEDCP